MSELEQVLRTELSIRMRYEMEMWQAHGFSMDRFEHHVDMIVRRILELVPTIEATKENKKEEK